MVSWRVKRDRDNTSETSALRRVVAVFGLVVGVGLATQLLGSSWYLGRMLPGTIVGDNNLSGLTLPQAQAQLTTMAAKYHVALAINDKQYNFTPDQLGVTYNTNQTLTNAYNARRATWWKFGAAKPQSFVYSLSSAKLAAVVSIVADDIGTQPVDATLDISGGTISSVADKDGFTVDKVALARQIEAHLASAVPAKLVTAPHRQAADIVVADLGTAENTTKQLMATAVTLTYNGRVWSPSAADIGSWLTFVRNDDGSSPHLVPLVDEAKLKSYVQTISNQVNVAAVAQLTTIENDVTTINREGVNGTAINQDAVVAVITDAVMNQQPLNYTITDSVVPFKTQVTNFKVLNYPKYIEVNLQKQHLWAWENGAIIYDSPITSGATGAGFPTAEGLFAIYYKTTNTHLRGAQYGPRYNYDVQVKYWMPFYEGYGLHDASWRNGNFGGQDYWRGGSHGCVNLPDATAAFIYNWSDVGTPVWVHE